MTAEEDYRRYASELRAECKRRGWPEPLRYGPDEPPVEGERAKACREVFDVLAHLRPTLRIVTAISRRSVEVYGKDLDVWVIHNEFPKSAEIREHFEQLAAAHGAELWEYDCFHRGTNPTWSRYHAGIYTWPMGLKGNFIWRYGETFTWGSVMSQAWEPTFVRIQPGPFGPVTSVGWEARREGIEDYRYLRRIETLCETAEGRKADEARRWLAELRQRVLGTEIPDPPDVHRFCGWDKADLWTECPQFARGELSRIRAQAIDLLLEFQEL